MAHSTSAGPDDTAAAPGTASRFEAERAALANPVIPVKHPGRWISAVVVIVLAGLFIFGAATNPAYGWKTYGQYLFDARFYSAAGLTLALTLGAMVIAVVVGVIIAIMRMSDNPVLSAVSWVYLWIFRGTPVYIQLVFWGLFPSLYATIDLGIPFAVQLIHLDVRALYTAFGFAVIGLALNEAAYMAEIVRAGIKSVPEGQAEAGTALGMSGAQIMWRTVLPQAMRVIIPPTGNELIGLLKTTSLVIAIPFSGELYGQARNISGVLYEPIPLLLVAATWYLAITSVLMVGQHYLEKYYARGSSRMLTPKQLRTKAGLESGIESA